MENKYIKQTKETWDKIARSFDITRRKPWDECIDFINKIKKDSIILDIGCGNGRHLIPCSKKIKKVIGLDISSELLKIVKEKIEKDKIYNVDLINSDAVNIPIKSDSIDSVLFIASLHNIKKRSNRINSLKELNRILKKNGEALISIWSRGQDKFRKYFNDENYKKNEFGDIDIFWRQHNLNVPRFYHLYSKKEFIEDIKKSGLELKDIKGVKYLSNKYYDNYFAIVKKI